MTTPKTSRRRLPPTTEMGRQLMKMGREKMVEEASRTAQRMVNERTFREQYEERLAGRSATQAVETAVQRGLINSIVGSLASEDITPMIDVAPITDWHRLEAWTDFERIYIRYHNDPDPRVMAAVLRGLMYHEGGHIRWTIPFPELLGMASAVDSNRTGVETRRLQQAWNALEDQRMETAVVSDSPRKAAFFVPMVMMELLDTVNKATMNYPLLVWRRYLPRDIRDACRAAFVDLVGEPVTVEIEETVDTYVKATTAEDMWAAVVRFAGLTDQLSMSLPPAADSHSNMRMGRTDTSQKMEVPVDPSMDADPAEAKDDGEDADDGQGASGEDGEEATTSGSQGAPGDEEEADEAGQASGGPEGQDGDEDGPEGPESDEEGESSQDGEAGSGAGKRSDTEADHSPEKFKEMLDEARAKAEEDRYNDRALDADVDAFHQAMERAGSKLPPYRLMPDPDGERIGTAEALADDLVQSFNTATQDRVPAWVEGQRTGVLNVGRYMTRQASGNMEYFKQWMDDDIPGYNLAVSVLLDYSGSMRVNMPEVAQVGYACKVACQRLDIPCTVALWDDDAVVLFDGLEEAEFLPVVTPNGNTDPSLVLADLDNQRFGKERHLVIIMTDGTWSFQDRSLAPYCVDGRMMMGIGFANDEAKAKNHAKALQSYGCPDSFPLTNLMELPWLMESLLIQMA